MGKLYHDYYSHQIGVYHIIKKRFKFISLGLLSTLFLFFATSLVDAENSPEIEITNVDDISGPYAPGNTVSTTVNVTLTGSGNGPKWRSTNVKIDDNNICVNTEDEQGAGNYNDDISFTAPLTSETYAVEFTAYKNEACDGNGVKSNTVRKSMSVETAVIDPDPTNSHQFNISGNVYRDLVLNDCDNKSECENRAERLPDWAMRLYKENAGTWELISTDITDIDGIYKFATQHEAGIYHVCEVLKSGWTQQKQTWSGSGYKVDTANLSGDTSEGLYCNTLNYDDAGDKSHKSNIGNIDTEKPVIILTDPASGATVQQVLVDASIEDNYKLNFFNIELAKIGDSDWNFTTQKQNVSGQIKASIVNFDLLDAAYYGTCDGHSPCATWGGGAELPDGEYKIRINAYDIAGNKQVYSHNFHIDNTAPENLAFIYTEDSSGDEILSGGYTDSEYFTFDLSADGSPTRWQLKYWNDILGSPYKESTPWNPTNLSTTGHMNVFGEYNDNFTQGEGKHYFTFSACDEHDNCSAFQAPFEVVFDKTEPATTWDDGGPITTNESSPTFTGNATDNLSGIANVQLRIEDGSGAEVQDYTSTGVVATDGAFDNELDEDFSASPESPLGDGTYTFFARAIDAAGNIESTAIMAVTVDTTPPQSTGGPNNKPPNNDNDDNGNPSPTAFNTTPFNTFGTFGTTPAGDGNVLSDTDGNNNGNEENNNGGEVQADSAGISSAATTAEAVSKFSWSWWWLLPILAALLILLALWRRREDEEEAA